MSQSSPVSPAPVSVKILREQGFVEIVWPDEEPVRFPFHFLRCHCPCASCVNEITGELMLDPAAVPLDISAKGAELCGNYALRIGWADGHDTGIYTWENLRRLAGLLKRD
jgi:DUF971 family protein